MVHDITLRQLGCAVNGADLKGIRDVCLKQCLSKLQTASRNVIRPEISPRPLAIETFRSALHMADSLTEHTFCWREKRTLRRVLAHAHELNAYLPA